jgi:hypothetical protein
MSSSSSNTDSGGFGITLHHEGQTDQNSVGPSPSGGSGDPGKQAVQENSVPQGTIKDSDVKNNKP